MGAEDSIRTPVFGPTSYGRPTKLNELCLAYIECKIDEQVRFREDADYRVAVMQDAAFEMLWLLSGILYAHKKGSISITPGLERKIRRIIAKATGSC